MLSLKYVSDLRWNSTLVWGPACSRQAKPEIKAEQLTPEQQARAKANREIADAKRRTMNARAARLKKAEEAGCTPGAARSRPRAGAGAPAFSAVAAPAATPPAVDHNATGILTLPDQNTSVNKKVLATNELCQPSVSP